MSLCVSNQGCLSSPSLSLGWLPKSKFVCLSIWREGKKEKNELSLAKNNHCMVVYLISLASQGLCSSGTSSMIVHGVISLVLSAGVNCQF